MDVQDTVVIFILLCTLISAPVHAIPDNDDRLPHMVHIDVTDILLFNLIKDIDGQLSQNNLHTVMTRILSRHQISLDKVDLNLQVSQTTRK